MMNMLAKESPPQVINTHIPWGIGLGGRVAANFNLGLIIHPKPNLN